MQGFVFYNKEEVLEFLKDHPEVKFCRFLFVDVLGRLLSFTVPSKEVEDAFNNGKDLMEAPLKDLQGSLNRILFLFRIRRPSGCYRGSTNWAVKSGTRL